MNVFRTYKFLLSAFTVLLAGAGSAQEKLVPLSGNMHLMSAPPAVNAGVKKVQSLPSKKLPFFDNFHYAYKTPFTADSLWLDSNVYINTGFPIAPRDIGVATFDGLNKHGYPYNFSVTNNASLSADTLTSVRIDLKHKANGAPYNIPLDSVIFSFYYQAKGNGDAPEPSDSLVLEFMNRSDTTWRQVWSSKGYNPSPSDTNFHYAVVPINDPTYADSLFQFRFRNKATTSGSLDHWHVDDIYLNWNRSLIQDTLSANYAVFAYPCKGMLKNYYTLPYEQYVGTEMNDSVHFQIRNNSYNPGVAVQAAFQYQIYNQSGAPQHFRQGSDNAYPFNSVGYAVLNGSRALPLDGYKFGIGDVPVVPVPFADTTYYTYRSVLINTNPAQNDTIYQKVNFGNYYAYDDGAAEVAYYLNTTGGKLAQRFTLNNSDTLRAVDIFFDPISYNATQVHEFRISIWADGGNGPSTTRLYQDSAMNPTYFNWGYNYIPRYQLTSKRPMPAGTYYIGIKQTDITPLNVGFDKNNDHMDKLYYDIGFGWTQSAIKGSLMIHPVFGRNSLVNTGIQEKTIEHKQFLLYPNPAQDQVYISTIHDNTRYTGVSVMSAMGQTVLQNRYEGPDEPIGISSLQSGIYFIYLSGTDGSTPPQKLIISR